MTDKPLCKDCRHVQRIFGIFLDPVPYCYSPGSTREVTRSLVTGLITKGAPPLAVAMRREGFDRCGPEGSLFEPRLPPLKRLAGWLNRQIRKKED